MIEIYNVTVNVWGMSDHADSSSCAWDEGFGGVGLRVGEV